MAYSDGKEMPLNGLAVILPDKGERPPSGFTIVEKTFSGHSGNLNKGLFNRRDVFLSYSRAASLDEDVITDVTIISDQESTPSGYVLLSSTSSGHTANLNKGSSGTRLFFCYKKEPPSKATMYVTNIGVLNKDDRPPVGYTRICRDVNEGSKNLSNSLFICFLSVPNPYVKRRSNNNSKCSSISSSTRSSAGKNFSDMNLNSKSGPSTPTRPVEKSFQPEHIQHQSVIYSRLQGIPILLHSQRNVSGTENNLMDPLPTVRILTLQNIENIFGYSFKTEFEALEDCR